jgi:Tfp pilus assembly protein PilN
MIKVNLLRENTPRKGGATFQELRAGFPLVLGLLLVGALIAGWHWKLSGEQANYDAQLQQFEIEKQRLLPIQAEMQQFKQQKATLENRMLVVQKLLENRYGPIRMMDALVSSVPDDPKLWLTGISQNGNHLTIEGNAFEVAAIARFISRLGQHDVFNKVDLDFWEEEPSSIRFQLTCITQNL